MSNIPKLVHYCWFGNQEMPMDLKKYVNNWKYILNDYEIVEWNESNFNISSLPFTQEAYDSKMWAFVSDYVRTFVLYKYGGIYLDTDMELINNFDHLLNNEAFCGFESMSHLGTAVLGSKQGNPWIKDMLDVYNDKHFINKDGTLDKTPNVRFFTTITEQKYKLKINNKFQQLSDVTIYPIDYFYPKNYFTKKTKITEDTIGIHHWCSSWCDPEDPTFKSKIINFMYSALGENITSQLRKTYKKLLKTNKIDY